MKRLTVAVLMTMLSVNAFCGEVFKFPAGATEGYWDDLSCWWDTWDATKNVQPRNDTHVYTPGTLYITNAASYVWGFQMHTPAAQGGVTLKIAPQGSATFDNKFIVGDDSGSQGCLVLASGAKLSVGSLNVGQSGCGSVTNSGTINVGNAWSFGVNSTGSGCFVHDSGSNSFPNGPKSLTVGGGGAGELRIANGTFFWYDSNNSAGTVFVGNGSSAHGEGKIIIENGGVFKGGKVVLGGTGAKSGSGELILRGGKFQNDSDRGQEGYADSLWFGAATNGLGGIRSDSYGALRGWGKFTYTSISQSEKRHIHARMGNGEIVGDGEGMDGRILDCSEMWQVTNVLFGVVRRTNGWHAVRKGAVVFPGMDAGLGDSWSKTAGTFCLGCSPDISKPDLLNAVKVEVHRDFAPAGFCFRAMLLAPDCAAAHADALDPSRYNALGFWRVGVFNDRTTRASDSSVKFKSAKVDFLYDAEKVAKTDSRIAVLRYDENAGVWVRVSKSVDQPADQIVSSGTLTTMSPGTDGLYNVGLFAVAEEYRRGLMITLK